MQIILTSLHPDLAEAWERFNSELPNVSVHYGSIFDVKCDAVVSPANSFGFMDGGIDRAYSNIFGWHVQRNLQDLIKQRHHGELLVGAAEIVSTGNSKIPYLISAPTMRVPMVLKNTINPYLAARAALLLVKYGTFPDGPYKDQPVAQQVKSLAFPGLGTGVGRVEPNTCANQVRQAIEEVILEKYSFPRNWSEAQTLHQKLYTDKITDLQWE